MALAFALWASAAALLAWWLARALQRARLRTRPAHLPPPEERPDYRRLAETSRVCPECGQPYETRSVVRAEQSCNACVEKRFEGSVQADRQFWIDEGWKEKG